MKAYQWHRHIFRLIADMMTHGVVVYGYGKNGKRVVAACEDLGFPVRAVYDQNVKEKLENGGG